MYGDLAIHKSELAADSIPPWWFWAQLITGGMALTIDPSQLILVVVNILMGGVLWFARRELDATRDAIEKMRADLTRIRDEIPRQYTRREDSVERYGDIMKVLDRLENKLDGKADK